jgi:hypothetical protein
MRVILIIIETLLGMAAIFAIFKFQPQIALLGGGRTSREEQEVLRIYLGDLTRSVRLLRRLGFSVLLLIIAVLMIIVWETERSGWSNLLALHAANGGVFLGIARFVFKRIDRYEHLLREALRIGDQKIA